MASLIFNYSGSVLKDAPNGGNRFDLVLDDLPAGMRVPELDEEVYLKAPDGHSSHYFVHRVIHVFDGPYTIIKVDHTHRYVR